MVSNCSRCLSLTSSAETLSNWFSVLFSEIFAELPETNGKKHTETRKTLITFFIKKLDMQINLFGSELKVRLVGFCLFSLLFTATSFCSKKYF